MVVQQTVSGGKDKSMENYREHKEAKVITVHTKTPERKTQKLGEWQRRLVQG